MIEVGRLIQPNLPRNDWRREGDREEEFPCPGEEDSLPKRTKKTTSGEEEEGSSEELPAEAKGEVERQTEGEDLEGTGQLYHEEIHLL